MIRVKDKKECCGCTACCSICAQNAITMKPDSLGFLYPEVNVELCVDCGLCNKICQFNDRYERFANFEFPRAYQFRIIPDEQLQRSQSGGAFFAIANRFIENGGFVYGAAFTATWQVTHQKATDAETLEALRMSKYVQSDIQGVFLQVKNDLKNGHMVLFSGTGCQVSGLKSYIPQRLHERLICVDVICHGVPSPQIWMDNIGYLEKIHKSKIIKACFRDKHFGWHGAIESYHFANGEKSFGRTSNEMYFSGLSVRESCFYCHYTNLKRVGDLTIGDLWSLEKDSPLNDEKGVSLVLVNSEKGQKLLDSIKDNVICKERKLEDCSQPQLQHPAKANTFHKKFINDYSTKGFLYVAKHYGDLGWRYKRKLFIKKFKHMIRALIQRY